MAYFPTAPNPYLRSDFSQPREYNPVAAGGPQLYEMMRNKQFGQMMLSGPQLYEMWRDRQAGGMNGSPSRYQPDLPFNGAYSETLPNNNDASPTPSTPNGSGTGKSWLPTLGKLPLASMLPIMPVIPAAYLAYRAGSALASSGLGGQILRYEMKKRARQALKSGLGMAGQVGLGGLAGQALQTGMGMAGQGGLGMMGMGMAGKALQTGMGMAGQMNPSTMGKLGLGLMAPGLAASYLVGKGVTGLAGQLGKPSSNQANPVNQGSSFNQPTPSQSWGYDPGTNFQPYGSANMNNSPSFAGNFNQGFTPQAGSFPAGGIKQASVRFDDSRQSWVRLFFNR